MLSILIGRNVAITKALLFHQVTKVAITEMVVPTMGTRTPTETAMKMMEMPTEILMEMLTLEMTMVRQFIIYYFSVRCTAIMKLILQ